MLSNHDAFVSCHNLFCLSKRARVIDSTTKVLYDDMGLYAFLSVKGRIHGLRNMRGLNVHDIVDVAIKITVITNTNHTQKITVTRNTETTKRLGRFGITSDAHFLDVVFIFLEKLGIDDY